MWVDVNQNTDEWWAMRAGKVGGSSLSKIMASSKEYLIVQISKDSFGIINTTTKKVLKKLYESKIAASDALDIMKAKDLKLAFGVPAKQLAVNLAIEQITKEPLPSGFSNEHTDRGHEQEPIARMMYEDMFFCDVTNGGFYDNGKTSVSPDGRVHEDGTIEIKCVIASVQFETIKRGGIDPKYKWQCAFELKESGRDWLDYVSFCSEFPEGKQLHVHRITKEESTDLFYKIDTRLAEFWPLVEESKRIIEAA